jgi:hypothetical protein
MNICTNNVTSNKVLAETETPTSPYSKKPNPCFFLKNRTIEMMVHISGVRAPVSTLTEAFFQPVLRKLNEMRSNANDMAIRLLLALEQGVSSDFWNGVSDGSRTATRP